MGCQVWSAVTLALLVGCGPRPGANEHGSDSATSAATTAESTVDSGSTTAGGGDDTTTGDSGPSVVCARGDGFCLAIEPEVPHCFCPEPLGPPISQPHAVVTADVDGDGWLDVVVGDKSRHDAPTRLRVFRGSDDGFAAPSLLAELSVSLETVVLGDLDEDGVLDVVGQPKTGAELPMLLSGGQSLPTSLAMHVVAGSEYRPAVALGDFDADGHLDLVGITNPRMGVMDLWVWPGLGDGTFAEPVSRPLGDFSPLLLPWLSIVDLDEDGVDDVVAMTNLWLPGVAGGGGALGEPTNLGFSTLRTFADADADGHLDTLAIHHGIDAVPDTIPVEVHRGEGQGVFTLLHTWSIAAADVQGDWADLDDDGLLDVLFVARPHAEDTAYFVLGHANGAGSYDALLESATPLPPIVGVAAVADLTHDGRSDILAWQREYDDDQSAVSIYVAQP